MSVIFNFQVNFMNWYYRLPIKTKLVLSFGTLIIFTILITTVSVLSMRESQSVAAYAHLTLEERYQRVNRLAESARKFQNIIFMYASAAEFNIQSMPLNEVNGYASEFRRFANDLVPGKFPDECREIKEGVDKILKAFESELIGYAQQKKRP